MDRLDDEAAIRALYAALADAWARGDTGALEELYTADSDYVTFDGSWLRGLEHNRRVHVDLFRGVLAGTRMVARIESIRSVTEDVAVVISTGALLWPWQKEIPARRRSRQTLVVVRRDGRWKIASFQNTRVRPMPPPESPMMRLMAWFLRWRLGRWNRHHGVVTGT